ncbi:MAG: nuclear transport factor 2 family protein [Actinobacteria bacterium]|nr:nuclear transport factor 2 family protein [Actinomycetota bacterium]
MDLALPQRKEKAMSADLESLMKRVQRLEDLEAIKKLKARYAAACDDCYNPNEMRKIFTEDAVWDGGEDFGVHQGREAIAKFFSEVSRDIEFAIHYFVQPTIEIDEDGGSARARWYLLMAATMKGGKAVWQAALELDQYRKVNGEWLQTEMILKNFFITPYEEGWHKVKSIR